MKKLPILIGFGLMFVGIGFFGVGFVNLWNRVGKLEQERIFNFDGDTETIYVDQCGEECKAEITRQVTLLGQDFEGQGGNAEEQEVVVVNQSTPTQTTYVPLGVTFASSSTSWENVADTEVWIDVNNDYGGDAYISWSASMKVAHGNGQAYVRLYDKTNGIAVNGSELTTVNNSDFENKSSGKLNLWSGNNEYVVQMKSLNGFEVTYSGGKIKVSY